MTRDRIEPDELEDGAELLDQVAGVLRRYLVLPTDQAAAAVVLWIVASHGAPAWNAAPRLVIKAPEKRCGKSRLLDLIEALCHHPIMTTNASPSAVYRSIGADPSDPPTLLIDEADAIFGPKATEHEDLRGLLNAGHQRGRPALRWDAGVTFWSAALGAIEEPVNEASKACIPPADSSRLRHSGPAATHRRSEDTQRADAHRLRD